MREILFRGKQRRNGQWIYGNYIGLDDDNTFICPRHEEASSLSCIDLVRLSMESVNPETIGQYTGETDKNGKKIFEGDIVRVNDKFIDTVVFGTGCFCMDKQIMMYEFTYQYFDGIEVIGNIHDNPELLKEGK